MAKVGGDAGGGGGEEGVAGEDGDFVGGEEGEERFGEGAGASWYYYV